jgi:hypothetical protein
MPRWFSRDKDGHLGVFHAEHMIPEVVGDLPEDDLDLAFEISRMLRIENRPVRGVHVSIRGGDVQMIASAADVQRYAEHVETVTDDVIVAWFTPPQRGRAADFMQGIRTFGTGEAQEASSLERAHAEGLCGGCAIDRAGDDLDSERLQGLGLFVYECDEQREILQRERVPSTPLLAARIGKLADRCLRHDGQFATAEAFPMRALKPPSST